MNEHDMKDFKAAYDAIPVPKELEGRVRASLQAAKQEQRRNKARKRRLLWQRTGAGAAAAMAAVVLLANSSPVVARAMEQVPVLGAITRVVTFRTFEDQGERTQAHVEVPQVEGGSEALNDAIAAYTDTIIEQYQADAARVEGADVEAESNHYSLDLSYQVVTDNDRVFALRFNQTLVMASGVESVKIYDVDKATGELLTLDDLFQPGSDYLSVITENIQEQMRAQMAADSEVYYWVDSEIEDLNFTRLEADTDFYLNDSGELVLVFDEGEVAPMYMGVVEFTIPSDILSGLADPAYLG